MSLKSQPFPTPVARGASQTAVHTLHLALLPSVPAWYHLEGVTRSHPFIFPFYQLAEPFKDGQNFLRPPPFFLLPAPFPFISRSFQAQHNLMGRRRPKPRLFNNALRGLFTKVRRSDEQLAAALMVRHIKCIIH